jgi:hypothetical protein
VKTLPPHVKLLDPGEECTVAWVNGYAVFVEQEHRWWSTTDTPPGAPEASGGEAVVCTVTAPISLTLTDLTAILYHWNTDYEDLASDDVVRTLIATAVVNWGSRHIAELRTELREIPPSGADARFWAYCHQRARAVFSTVPVGPHRGSEPVRATGAANGVVR